MLSKIKEWYKSLPQPKILTYEMRKMLVVDNVTIYARFSSPEWQRMSDRISKNRIHMDGNETEVLCHMPNCHNVYFEFKMTGSGDRRVGFSNLVDFGNNEEEAITNYANTVLVKKAKEKGNYYAEMFDKKEW